MLKHNSWQPNRSLSQADSVAYKAALAAVCKGKLARSYTYIGETSSHVGPFCTLTYILKI